jgi:hypothetical protein
MKSSTTKTKKSLKDMMEFTYAPGPLKIYVGKLYKPKQDVWLCDFDSKTKKAKEGGSRGTFISSSDTVFILKFIQASNIVSLNHFIGWSPQTGVVVLYNNKLCILESAELFGLWFEEIPGQ